MIRDVPGCLLLRIKEKIQKLVPVLFIAYIMFTFILIYSLLQEMRRRRNEVNVELRKARKDDQLQKRRNIGESDEPGSPLQESNCQSQTISMTLEEIIEGILFNFCTTNL